MERSGGLRKAFKRVYNGLIQTMKGGWNNDRHGPLFCSCNFVNISSMIRTKTTLIFEDFREVVLSKNMDSLTL